MADQFFLCIMFLFFFFIFQDNKIQPSMILKICLEITTLRHIFIHPFILFFLLFPLHVLSSVLWL